MMRAIANYFGRKEVDGHGPGVLLQPSEIRLLKLCLAIGLVVGTALCGMSQSNDSSASSANTNGSPSISGEYGVDGLRMNFHGAPLKLVLDYLSEAAGFIINKQAEISGTVEVWSKQPVTKDEAIELLASVLKQNGYTMTRNGRILTIFGLDRAKTADTEIVVHSDPNLVQKSDEMQTQIITVRYVTAAQLVSNLQQLLPTSATLSANESANTLILVASKTDIKRVLKIVSALDSSMATSSTLKVRSFRYADAKEVAGLVTQLFSQQNSSQASPGGFGPGGAGGFGPGGNFPGGGFGGMPSMTGQNASTAGTVGRDRAATGVIAVADDRSNSVVISAPRGLLPTIDDILNKLDQQVSDLTEIRIFRLRHAEPSELADQFAQLFPDQTSNTGQSANMPFFFPGGPPGQSSGTGASASERMKKIGKVLTVPDPRTSSIIVTASKTLMPQIASMVEALDAEQGKREVVSFFELHHADSQDIYQNLQDLFNRSSVRMDNNNQNSFLGRNNPLTQRETQNQQSTTGETMSTGLGGSSGGTPGGRSGP